MSPWVWAISGWIILLIAWTAALVYERIHRLPPSGGGPVSYMNVEETRKADCRVQRGVSLIGHPLVEPHTCTEANPCRARSEPESKPYPPLVLDTPKVDWWGGETRTETAVACIIIVTITCIIGLTAFVTRFAS